MKPANDDEFMRRFLKLADLLGWCVEAFGKLDVVDFAVRIRLGACHEIVNLVTAGKHFDYC